MTAFEHVFNDKHREARQRRIRKDGEFVLALRELGYKPQLETTSEFCRRMYEEEGADAPMLPRKQATRRLVGEKHLPRAAPLYDFLAARFAQIAFGWRPFVRREKNYLGNEIIKHGVEFNNYPTLAGRHLSIYELLFVPIHLVDQVEQQVAAKQVPEQAVNTDRGGWNVLND